MTIGLNLSGSICHAIDFPDGDVDVAMEKWAKITGHSDSNWDRKKRTYFGWPIVVTNDKALTRGEVKPPFYY